MFDSKYHEWNKKRIKGIIDFYGYKFFFYKRVLDLGCGHGDIGGALYRLGSDVTASDARQEHLKIVSKKFPGMKVVQADVDRTWPFVNKNFDMVVDLGLLCHTANYEDHIKRVCSICTHLILETEVCDSTDPFKCFNESENKNSYELSVNGVRSVPSTAAIERALVENGMNFRRVDDAKFNAPPYTYDWQEKNTGATDPTHRRIWFCVKASSPIQFAAPSLADALPAHTHPQVIQPSTMSAHRHIVSKSPSPPAHMMQAPEIFSNVAPRTIPVALPPTTANLPSIKSGNSNYAPFPTPKGNKRFVVVIPSYKNSNWCEKNIRSALNQNYRDYRIIFVDDCSPDDTFEKTSAIVNTSHKASQVTLIKNNTRKGALANLYDMIHSCEDDEIILTLDGDDWFPDDNVLTKLNNVYTQNDVWITYGQYKNSTDGQKGVAQPYPKNIVDNRAFRQHTWGASHLRTFYAWLFKQIHGKDLLYNGSFFPMTWDFAMMFPMLEMAGPRSMYLDDILYIYNLENPINDHKVNVKLQRDLDACIRAMPRYNQCYSAPRPSVGLILIATGKYDKFIQGMVSSADNYFMNGFNVTYYIFSDKEISIRTSREAVRIPIEHKQFPFASMDRFKHFTQNADKLTTNYLYYVDVDCLFVDAVGPEILGNLAGVLHCGFFNLNGPVESNPKSCLYVDNNYPRKYNQYFGGGFSGGRRSNYLQLSKWCYEHIEQDVANGVIPIWHDETAINRYFLDNNPDVILSPSYHYPQSNIEFYKTKWGGRTFHPKIMLLDKNHHEVRTA